MEFQKYRERCERENCKYRHFKNYEDSKNDSANNDDEKYGELNVLDMSFCNPSQSDES